MTQDTRAEGGRSRFGRWTGQLLTWTGPMGKAQIESPLRDRRGEGLTLPEPVLRLAQDEYDRQYPGQPYERMQQRGGLGVLEIVGLLADSLERHQRVIEALSGPASTNGGEASANAPIGPK